MLNGNLWWDVGATQIIIIETSINYTFWLLLPCATIMRWLWQTKLFVAPKTPEKMKNLEIGKNSWCCDIKGYCAAVLMFVGFLQHNKKSIRIWIRIGCCCRYWCWWHCAIAVATKTLTSDDTERRKHIRWDLNDILLLFQPYYLPQCAPCEFGFGSFRFVGWRWWYFFPHGSFIFVKSRWWRKSC